jgi:Asp-tRNA(Asn)/Glu-tRNA(Gln) amidotransferase B subunit
MKAVRAPALFFSQATTHAPQLGRNWGSAMKATKGKANPKALNYLLMKKLE